MIDKVQLKKDMMNLWKNIFGDSDEYIKLYFGTYFDNAIFEYRYVGDKLISQLLCVPYLFSTSSNNVSDKNIKYSIRSGYLCGLATLPEYRGKGIMREMINNCHKQLFKNNCTLSILIPASEPLRFYYNKFNYSNISFYYGEKYVSNHKFCDLKYNDISDSSYIKYIEYNNVNAILFDVNKYINYFDNICNVISDTCVLQDIYSYFKTSLNALNGAVINHTYADFIAILRENNLSGGHILYLKNKNNKPLGLLCCSNIIEGEATVQLLLAESEESGNILLETLKSLLPPDTSITVRHYEDLTPPTHSAALAAPYSLAYSPEFSEGEVIERDESATSFRHPKSFAMARILNVAEILKFVASLHPDSEFSILIKEDEFAENEGLYEVKDGIMKFTPIADMSEEALANAEHRCSSEIDWFELSVSELAAILWRRPSEPAVEAAIAIPRLPLTAFLMLE